MNYRFGYGKGYQNLEIIDTSRVKTLRPKKISSDLSPSKEVLRSIINPIGSKALGDIVFPNEKIVIITSDITRPVPSKLIISILIDELYKLGINKEDITIVFALGSHRKHTKKEILELVGESIFKEIRCIDSDSNDVVRLGITEMGTPVDIFSVVANADRRICIGNIDYHYFAGYSGGSKAIMPGVSTREAIQANHSKMVSPYAIAGNIKNNPVRKDLEDAIKFCPIDFIINVILDENKRVIKSVAGDFIDAHREGCKFLDTIYKIDIEEKVDIVIVSQGGAPKDINLYQTQKALDNAKHAIKDGGIIILVGACNEGMGEKTFKEWMLDAKEPKDLIDRIKNDFKLGGHKAAAIAMILEKAQIFLISEFDDEFVESIFMTPFNTLQNAFNEAIKLMGEDSKVILMPYGGSTLPNIKV